jgi:hypothetical protein
MPDALHMKTVGTALSELFHWRFHVYILDLYNFGSEHAMYDVHFPDKDNICAAFSALGASAPHGEWR